MWPYTPNESDWLARRPRPSGPVGHALPRSAELAAYIRRGKQLRAEALARVARGLGAAGRRALSRAVRPALARWGVRGAQGVQGAEGDEVLPVIAGGLRAPLTSIRSSAEILRDNPDIDPAERTRFLDIVLAEEARLEALVSALLEASSVERRRRLWQVRLAELRLEREAPGLPGLCSS